MLRRSKNFALPVLIGAVMLGIFVLASVAKSHESQLQEAQNLPEWQKAGISFLIGGLMILLGGVGLSQTKRFYRWLFGSLSKRDYEVGKVELAIYKAQAGFFAVMFAALSVLFIFAGVNAIGPWITYWMT